LLIRGFRHVKNVGMYLLSEPIDQSKGPLWYAVAVLYVWVALCFLGASNAHAFNNFPGETISGTGSITRSIVGATGEPSEPINGTYTPINSMWYSWTAPSAGQLVVQTCSATLTDYNTVLSSYTGTAVTGLTFINRNNDRTGCATTTGTANGSRITLFVVAGTTYRIQVDGFGAAVGQFLLQYTFTAASYTTSVTDASATEGADTAAFNLRLRTRPTASTIVTIGADPTGQCTFSPSSLTFTTTNWNTNRAIIATAVNDLAVEGVHTCGNATITATGSNYSTVTGTTPNLTVNDNDQTSLVIATTDSTATEGGGTGAFTAVLSAAPSGTVTVTIGADASGQCNFAPTTLTFTTVNWATVQTVTATAVNDLAIEGTHSCSPGAITPSGGGVTTLTGATPVFTITDNDIGAINIITTDNLATEGGGTGTFTAQLSGIPTGTVTVAIGASPGGQCVYQTSPFAALATATVSLTFTALNWNNPQTVRVTAVDDLLVEGAHTCTTGSIVATGGGITGATGPAPTFFITDNDAASILVEKDADEPSVSAAGDEIVYTVTVTNTGNVPATGLTVTDSLVPMICPTSGTNIIAALAPAAAEVCTATYTATQANFDSNGGGDGDIDNTVSVTGTSGGVPVNGTSQYAVLCPQIPSLDMAKTSVPVAGPLTLGQTVVYTYTVTNNGNVTLSNVNIDEILFTGASALGAASGETRTDNAPTGDSPDGTANDGVWTTLGIGDVARFTVSYLVTQADIDLLQ
jgi:uncharacterized repeat protein (TIGR01451 family)